MKTTILSAVLASGILLGGCGTDSKDKANEVNEKKIDQQATAISDDAKKDAKDVANNMVELFSMGMTEYELSKLALQKATNPEVKSYAQRAMNEHQQNEKQLRDMARTMNITLPATMAKDGKDRVEDLQDEKPGTAFDLQYLKEMNTVNDKAADKADDLADNAPNDAVKTFARKLEDSDKKHRDQAKQMRNALD
jgi:putative membrane protein